MSNGSGENNGVGVWLASGALVVILFVVVFGGSMWRWIAVQSHGRATQGEVVHSQTIMKSISFSDERSMQTTMNMLTGQSVSQAMGLLRLPTTCAMSYPESTVCYTIAVKRPIQGVLKLTADRGHVTGVAFEKN